ncbi:M64 family metallopeptidase [Vulgatibacter sp.]|uniref:M64 family metallopeptidase n=1 Tax=Vulgatibacter sp. TaxID=1971226 RepID=UPI003569D1AB
MSSSIVSLFVSESKASTLVRTAALCADGARGLCSAMLMCITLLIPNAAVAAEKSVISQSTLMLLVSGDATGLTIERAQRMNVPYIGTTTFPSSGNRLELLGADSTVLYSVALDGSGWNLGGSDWVIDGDILRRPTIAFVVKIPDLTEQQDTRVMAAGSVDEVSLLAAGSFDVPIAFDQVYSNAALELLATRGWKLQMTLPEVRTLFSNGPSEERYDIVVLGDGYTLSEKAKFFADAEDWSDWLLRGTEPYASYRSSFNVHAVFRASAESGADHPDASPPIVKDTYYDATYAYNGAGICLFTRDDEAVLRDAGLAPDFEGVVAVIVNDARHGGCSSGPIAVAYQGSSGVGNDTLTHEFGHAFGGLYDEYNMFTTYSGPEPQYANMTADHTCSKWNVWHGIGGVGCFEGAGGHMYGLFRPEADCKMRASHEEHCEICKEALVLRLYSRSHMIGSFTPSALNVTVMPGGTSTFAINSLVPGGGVFRWYVNGALKQAGGSSFTYTFGGGEHIVRVVLEDTTPFVRRDPANLLETAWVWMVSSP